MQMRMTRHDAADPGRDPAAGRTQRAEQAARVRIFATTQSAVERVKSLAALRRGQGMDEIESIRTVLRDYPELQAALARETLRTKKEDEMTTDAVTETSAYDELVALTTAARGEDKTLTADAAWSRVSETHPALYRRYQDEMTLGRGGVSLASVKVTIEKVKQTSAGGSSAPAALTIINEKVREIMAATNLTEREALDQAFKENPSLYPQYVQQLKLRPNGRPSIDQD